MSNRVGIEVQVEFPTVKELQDQLQEKWAKVKKGFEGKINIDIDKNSLRSAKTTIRKALKEDTFEITLDANTTSAEKKITNIIKRVEELDKKLAKKRELKIDFQTLDFNKSFRDILKDVKDTDDAVAKQTRNIRLQTQELQKQGVHYDKIRQVQKQLADGSIKNTVQMTYNDSGGRQNVVSQDANGSQHTFTEDRVKALKEIETIMKRINTLEKQREDSVGKQSELIDKELKTEKEQLGILKGQYQERHKMDAMKDPTIEKLQREREILKVAKEQSFYEKVESEEKAKIKAQLTQLVKLENAKETAIRATIKAQGEERRVLAEKAKHYQRSIDKLKEETSIMKNLTKAQKEELNQVKQINRLELQRTKEAEKQRQLTKQQTAEENAKANAIKSANSDILAQLKRMLAIEEKIAQMKNQQAREGWLNANDEAKLGHLKAQLKEYRDIYRTSEDSYKKEGLITQALQTQVSELRQLSQNEKSRIAQAEKTKMSQEDITDSLKQHKALTSEIGKLQRDLVFAGMREENIIEDRIGHLKRERQLIEDKLTEANKMPAVIKKEIAEMERLQSEQMALNRLRQDARDKDRTFNDAGGVIDPWQAWSTAQQGAMAILEPLARLDEAMTGIIKVAEATDAQFKEFANTSYDVASSLGVTADQYMLAVEKWVTAGKTFKESQELAQVALTGAFVGNIKPDDMVKYMSVPLNSYTEAGLDANDVINVMNETANSHAVEMEELGKAYVRSANTAKDAGVSFGELTGMITGAQEATRKGGERIGTGIKSIAMNITQISAQNTAGYKKKFDFFTDMGISIQDANGEMLSMTEVLDNVHDKWDTMSSDEKGTTKFYLAGKEHAETLSAILDQWDKSVKSTIDLSNEELGQGEMGSAYLEHAKQSDSLRFKLAELQNSWDELMYTLSGDGGTAVTIIDHLITALESANKLAQNDKLMEVLKLLIISLGMKAGWNMMGRVFDGMATGSGQIFRNFRNINAEVRALRKNAKKTSGDGDSMFYAGGSMGNGGKSDKGDDLSKDNKNHKNESDGNSTFYAGGLGRNGAKEQKKIREEMDKTTQKAKESIEGSKNASNTAMKSVGRIGKGVLSMIPLLGDGLLIMEMMGVPVFDTIGKGFDTMLSSAKEVNAEIVETRKQFLATNKVLNGEVAGNDKKFESVEDTYITDRQSGGYMDDKEFVAFQEQFNGFASELGVDIEVSMNDTAHIEEKLQQIKKYLHEVKQDEVIKLETKVEGTEEEMAQIEKQYADRNGLLEEQKQKLTELQARKEEYERRYEETGSISHKNEIDRLNSKEQNTKDYISYLEGAIEENKQTWNEHAQTLSTFATEIEGYVNAGGSFTDLQKSSVMNYLREAVPAYNELNGSVGRLVSAEKKLKDGKSLTNEEYRKLQALYPEISVLNRNQTDEILDIVSTKRKEGEEALVTAKKNIDGAASAVGAEVNVRASKDKTLSLLDAEGKKIDTNKKKIEDTPSTKRTDISVVVSLVERVKGIWNKIFGGSKNTSSTHTIHVNSKDKSVSLGDSSSSQSISSSSASVSTGGEAMDKMVEGNQGVSNATSTKAKPKATTASNANARVDQDVWRYWSHELFNIARLEQSMSSLERAIVVAGDNQTKLISLYKQQYSVMKQQYNSQKTLKSKKDQEMNSVLGQLKKYGFKVNTSSNTVTNLGYAKNLKGDKAEKANTLLSQYRSLYDEMNGINNTLRSIGNEMTGMLETIKQAEIAKEFESFEGTLKKISAVMKVIQNSNSLFDSKLSLVGGQDKELGMSLNRGAMQQSQRNLANLKAQYDSLSVRRVNNPENAEKFKAELEAIASAMLSEADSIIAYQDAINQLEFDRVTADLGEFTGAVERNLGRLENTRENLKEGILSGTDVGDLASGAKDLDLSRNNVFERQANARLKLEADINKALDMYAKMNVDRTKRVVNTQLRLTSDGYSQMLKMYDTYQNGQKATYKGVEAQFKGLESIGKLDPSYTLVTKFDKAFETIRAKQTKLDADLDKALANAKTFEEREKLTNAYVSNSLKVQEEYFKALVQANKDSITELNNQLKDTTLTDDTRASIIEEIAGLEDEILDAQNEIKDTIAERLEYENSLMQESISQYDDYIAKVENALSIIDSVGGNSESKGVLLEALLGSETDRKNAIKSTIDKLTKQLAMYEEGSFEWKLINEQVKEFNDQLTESNNSIIGINQSILENSFSDIMKQVEQGMFDGKTLKEFQNAQELWLSTLEREFALEDMYERIAELGADGHKLKLEELEKREQISRFEMDYMDKQLTLLELQKKMANLSEERTIQTLKQDENGTWNWVYEADASEVGAVEDEIKELQKEMLEMENQAREAYLSKLESILADAQSGEFETIKDFKDAIAELGSAYESILKGAPEISNDYLNKIIEAYQKYLEGTDTIVGDIIGSGVSKSSSSFNDSRMATVASNLADAILGGGLTLNPASSSPSLNSSKNSSQVFHIEKIEFPNAESESEIRNALLSLPSMAEQHKFKKN